MAKKVSDVVMGMLSDAGSATRAPAPTALPPADPPAPTRPEPTPVVREVIPAAPAPVTTAADRPAATPAAVDPEAPRTLRLRPEAATRLRAAWLEAKREDVLLTAQDFASDLVMEALVSRRRRRAQTPA